MKLVFIVEDTFSITGRGTVLSGTSGGGVIKTGDYLYHDRTGHVISIRGVETMGLHNIYDRPIGLLVGPWPQDFFQHGDTLTGCIVSVQK